VSYSFDEPHKLLQLRESVREKIGRLQTVMDALELYELASDGPAAPVTPPGSGTRPRQHVEVHNYGTLGTLNTGEVLGSIHSHASTVTGLSADAFREAVDALATAIAKDQALSDDRRKEALESIDALAEEAGREPEKRRRGVLRGIMLAIPGAIELSANALQAWDKYGPTIQTHLDQLMK
jgi:hypothetical protein